MAHSDSPGLSKRLGIERRRIAAQHQLLGELWQSFLDPFETGDTRSARLAFTSLCEGVTAHFDVEERIHIPALHGANPSVTEALQEIVSDHRRFRNELNRIAEALSAADLEAVAAMVAPLIRAFADHEVREEDLFKGL